MENPRNWKSIKLPEVIPVFPLRDALLLPHAHLPLNIFEPRYTAMTDYALGHHRAIGMVRAREDGEDAPLYETGCVGRITSFAETDDRRYVITLTGITRFHIAEELKTDTPFRMVRADYEPFRADPGAPAPVDDSLREEVLVILDHYLTQAGLETDWESIEKAPTASIINSISVSCPFEPDERQALLEAENEEIRARTLIALMEMALAEEGGPEPGHKHRLQ